MPSPSTRRQALRALALACLLASTTFASSRVAAQRVTLRIATREATTSTTGRALDGWKRALGRATHDRVALQIVTVPPSTTDAALARDLNAGQYDGALLSTTGLGLTVPSALLFATPGVFADYPELDAGRTRMAGDVSAMFQSGMGGGYKLLGFVDRGRARLFARSPFASLGDLGGRTFFVDGSSDFVCSAFAQALGGVRIADVAPGDLGAALASGRIATLYQSALSVASIAPAARPTHVSKRSFGFVVSAVLLQRASFERIPAAHRAAFATAATAALSTLRYQLRADDDAAYRALLAGGMIEVDMPSDASTLDALVRATSRTQSALVATRTYSQTLLDLALGR